MPSVETLMALFAAMSGIEWFAAAIGVLAVWLTARQNIWCWPIGLVMVLLYTWIFFSAKLYANMALQIFFAATQLYGWWHWRHAQGAANQPRTLTLTGLAAGLGAGALASVAIGLFLAYYTDASSPVWDASLTAFSLVAQLWMARKYTACWPLWLVVDVLYVGLFIEQQLFATAILYGVFALLAVHGWRSWQRASA